MIRLQYSSEVVGQAVAARPASYSQRRRVMQLVGRVIATWMGRSRQRRALANLDDRLLEDIGITRSAAAREGAKPFWR